MLLTPTVLECMRFSAKSSQKATRKAVNYEFDLYLDGNRQIRIDDIDYCHTEYSLVFKKPGQIISGISNYNMYALTLDFSNAVSNENNIYRPVVGEVQSLCDFAELNSIPTVFAPYHFDELKELLKKLSECSYPNVANKKKQEQYVKEFLLLVLYDCARHARVEDQHNSLNSHVDKACDYISKNFRENISVKQVAKSVNLTENHLIKLFKNQLNQTPNQYILNLKLTHARHLILQSDQTIQEIAFACGFNTPSYFTRQFYKKFSVLPNQLR